MVSLDERDGDWLLLLARLKGGLALSEYMHMGQAEKAPAEDARRPSPSLNQITPWLGTLNSQNGHSSNRINLHSHTTHRPRSLPPRHLRPLPRPSPVQMPSLRNAHLLPPSHKPTQIPLIPTLHRHRPAAVEAGHQGQPAELGSAHEGPELPLESE